jgi:predicted RecB family nuclease
MQLIDGQPVFSATDLVGFLACGHLTELEVAAIQGLVKRPIREDKELDVIRERGFQHEARFLADLEAQSRLVTRIELDKTLNDPATGRADRAEQHRRAAAETEQAIRRGDDVIYQAVFFDGRWLGFADFLLRVETPSDLGAWSYEVADTKLARHVKASALLQICSYVEQLTRIQGIQPEWMLVALGGGERAVERHRVGDYMAYYRTSKRLFEEYVADLAAGGPKAPRYPETRSYPEPVEHCDVCRWAEVCTKRRRADDDLSLVAGIAARQREALKNRGIATRRGLASLDPPMVPPLANTRADTLERVHLQAKLQVRGEDEGKPLYELIEPARLKDDGGLEPDKGLAALPEPRPGDLFFDIEGDPYAFDDGVEYLFGVLEPGQAAPDGEPTFHAIWARDAEGDVTREAEKAAFEQVIDLIIDRLDKDPSIHIYHYAPYEPTALGRLMGRHATREEQVDRLLRGGVLVDLYRAVRQGIRASVESYSIKKLEPLYAFRREIGLRDAGSSIAEFEAWLQVGGEHAHDDKILDEIERYNRDDVVSTRLLRDWLEERRLELEALLGEKVPRPGPREGEAAPELSDQLARVEAVTAQLVKDVPADEQDRTPAEHGRWLLAQLLSWHRREDKSFWWRFFYLRDALTDEERVAEREPIGLLTPLGAVGATKRSTIYRFSYPDQEHAISVGSNAVDPATGESAGTVHAVDLGARTIDLKRANDKEAPNPRSLVPCDVIRAAVLQASLLEFGEWVARFAIDADGPYRAARDLLMRQPPRVDQAAGEPIVAEGADASDAAVALIGSLDGSCLAIQGPPGAGKTHTGARMILELIRAGRKVGITSNSHKVIGKLLDEVVSMAAKTGQPVRIGQKPGESGPPSCAAAVAYSNESLLAALTAGEIDVAAGTAWVWARPEYAGSVDVLFIDEAGQFALANTIAVSPATRSLVLLGDPQQLDQPLQGSHPPGAERSALAHLLDQETTMPPRLGLFLEETWRLHPDICAYTSSAFYADRLTSHVGLENQDLAGRGVLSGTGTRFVAVRHEGDSNESTEEVEVVCRLVTDLLRGGATWTDRNGVTERLTLDDILIVAPYNAQVGALEAALPAGARVGTVDKFQGQEAPISIYSMASSSPADAPRGMEFLYSLNRLNVATSRARCLTVVVASPELLRVRARTPRQMRLANGLCEFVDGWH